MARRSMRPATTLRLRTPCGHVHEFDSLHDFVRFIPNGRRGRLMIDRINGPPRDLFFFLHRDGEYVLEDLWGDPVPREDVLAAWRHDKGIKKRSSSRSRAAPHRSGPVPGTHGGGGGGGAPFLRHPRTIQESRAWEDLATADADGETHAIRARRKRSARNLPDTFDDIPRGPPERCWKRQRRTQHRD